MRTVIFYFFFSIIVPSSLAQQREKLNHDWQYLENNNPDVSSIVRAQGWTDVDLPHSWNAFDATDAEPGYRRDLGWYRRSADIALKKDQRYLLYFEGANLVTKVYVNGKLAGGHVGGYLGFEVDLTDFLVDGLNQLYVSVDNSVDRSIIPSQKADFFIYGGLIRDVWWCVKDNIYVESVLIRTPQVDAASAATIVSLTFSSEAQGNVRCKLFDPNGKEVAKTSQRLKGAKAVEVKLPPIKNPQLWSPASPNRYRLEVDYLDGSGSARDRVEESIGYRYFEFEDNGPFFLNGERLKLRGTHLHEEYAGYGAAMPDSLRLKDLKMIKEMGANFVRLAHYPQDPSVYQACDSLGLIVWDEVPWCRGGMGDQEWQSNTLRLLEEQILQNYNHPSIVFWSLGNEVYWLPDYPDGDNRDSINAFLTEMNERAHQLDPDRFTAIRKYYEGSEIVDVFSPSIWAGWYGGAYQQYESALEDARLKYQRFVHAEYGGSSHLGRHIKEPYQIQVRADASVEEMINQASEKNVAKYGDWSENYINDLFDWHLSVSESLDWFAGNLQWAFKDFGTPLRPENAIPYINQKGLVDRAGRPKDAYYVFKSYWSEEPFAYIESHTWTERQGAEGEVHPIKVYSNAHRVTLMHNGKELTTKQRDPRSFPAQGLVWNVVLTAGKNTLEAVGYGPDGERIARDELIVTYGTTLAGNPKGVAWKEEELANGNLLITATMVDRNGRRCLALQDKVYFDIMGDGELLSAYGIMSRSSMIELANGQATIEVSAGKRGATLELRSQNFKGDYYRLTSGSEVLPKD